MVRGKMTNSQRTRIAYFKKLAKEVLLQSPKYLDNRDVLYKAYMEHIEKIRKEKQWDD